MCIRDRATALSEAVSACMMLLFYHREARRCFAGEKARRPRDPARRLWDILWPVEGGRVLASALHTAENMLVPACLAVYLANAGGRSAALEQYGVLKGMALPLLTFPFGLLGSLSVLLMPEITQAHILGQTKRLNALLNRMLRLTGYFSALAGTLFWVWGRPLAQLLYRSAEAGFYLETLAPAMPAAFSALAGRAPFCRNVFPHRCIFARLLHKRPLFCRREKFSTKMWYTIRKGPITFSTC